MECRFPKDLYDLGEHCGHPYRWVPLLFRTRFWSVWSADFLRICMTWASIVGIRVGGFRCCSALGSGQYGVQIS